MMSATIPCQTLFGQGSDPGEDYDELCLRVQWPCHCVQSGACESLSVTSYEMVPRLHIVAMGANQLEVTAAQR